MFFSFNKLTSNVFRVTCEEFFLEESEREACKASSDTLELSGNWLLRVLPCSISCLIAKANHFAQTSILSGLWAPSR